MKPLLALPILTALTSVTSCNAAPSAPSSVPTKAIPVKIERTATGFRLLRGGAPYFIQGAGGSTHLDMLKAAGANSVRTWGVEQLDALLPQARRLGLTVAPGMWLGHERHGFNYADEKAVAAQREKVRQAVLKYKDDPAILLWGVGNEMEGDGKNPLVWKAVNDLARMIKTLDPNHPVITVIAEIPQEKIDGLKQFCPDIDALGVNSYGGLGSLATRLKAAGWERPFIVTEFGTLGPWEGGRTAWGAPLEMNSTEKADFALMNYERSVASQRDRCLGAYAFLWGHKQERTATWFGMLLPDGSRLPFADAMSFAWTGRWPSNTAPRLVSLETDAAMREVAPGARFEAQVYAQDMNNDALSVQWEVRSETTDARGGGDAQQEPPAHPASIVQANGTSLIFQTPQAEGAYRLFVWVRDGKGGAATANVPFFVTKK